MNQNNKFEAEIDLVDLLKKLWKNNLKIFTSVSISLIVTFIFLLINPLKTKVSVPYSSISFSEQLKYKILNLAIFSQLNKEENNFFNPETLMNIYREQLSDAAATVLEEYNIITRKSFKTNNEFISNLKKIFILEGPYSNQIGKYYTLNLNLQNIEYSEEIIKKIDKRANESVREIINGTIENYISYQKSKILEKNIIDEKRFKELNSNFETQANVNNLIYHYESSPLFKEDKFRATQLNLINTSFYNPQHLIYFLVLFISFSSSSIYILSFINHKD